MRKPNMTQTLLFILVVAIGFFYAFKYGNKAKKDIAEFENKQKNIESEFEGFVELKYFGKIDLNNPEEYIDVETNINGNDISIDLNIILGKISKSQIQPTKKFIENLDKIEKEAHKQLLLDFENGITVKEYVDFQIEDFDNETLESIGIDINDKKSSILKNIHLKRIGIYPEELDNLAIFDYTVSEELTNWLIVMSFNSKGEFVRIYTES